MLTPNLPYSHLSRDLRLQLLDMIYESGSGHVGGCLSSLDILISLYFSDLFNFNRDHFILSAGHLACALYTVLSAKNYFPSRLLSTYTDFNSLLQGHVSTDVPGVEYSSGSLGQGLSFAAGLALGDKSHTTVCLTTDGEHQEGQIWESLMFAQKYQLSNLINIVDCNGTQVDGRIEEIMPLNNLAAKYVQFGWTVTTVNGHNLHQIAKALKSALNHSHSGYPSCVIAKTVLGRGVSFMEHQFKYHDIKNLDPSLYLQAKNDLESY
ncbi:MAG TPA: transketolase [Candidatus Woesebacteria bacterium]|nr:transketolase [Candidatus Woesebacteria bacterium]